LLMHHRLTMSGPTADAEVIPRLRFVCFAILVAPFKIFLL